MTVNFRITYESGSLWVIGGKTIFHKLIWMEVVQVDSRPANDDSSARLAVVYTNQQFCKKICFEVVYSSSKCILQSEFVFRDCSDDRFMCVVFFQFILNWKIRFYLVATISCFVPDCIFFIAKMHNATLFLQVFQAETWFWFFQLCWHSTFSVHNKEAHLIHWRYHYWGRSWWLAIQIQLSFSKDLHSDIDSNQWIISSEAV